MMEQLGKDLLVKRKEQEEMQQLLLDLYQEELEEKRERETLLGEEKCALRSRPGPVLPACSPPRLHACSALPRRLGA